MPVGPGTVLSAPVGPVEPVGPGTVLSAPDGPEEPKFVPPKTGELIILKPPVVVRDLADGQRPLAWRDAKTQRRTREKGSRRKGAGGTR